MSENKKTAAAQSPAKPSGLLGSVTTCLTTTFFIMVAAWCFLSAVEGWRSLHQHRVEASLNRIDALLTIHSWISPPAWVNRVQAYYAHWRTSVMKNETSCLNNLSGISQGLFQFHGDSSSPEHNPFAKKFTQTCSVMKSKILPLLSGTLAVVLKRFWVFMMALPLFLLSLIVGFVDGLVQRDIRKFKGARESTLLFHKIKRSGTALFFLPLFAYFAWLSPVSPAWFFVPMAVALGFWLTFSVRFFKKYV